MWVIHLMLKTSLSEFVLLAVVLERKTKLSCFFYSCYVLQWNSIAQYMC